jgi:hypothetical protein
MCDKLVFDMSQEGGGETPSVFIKKDWLNILDNQSQNYNSNQSVIDTSQLSNSNKWLSYREAYLQVPLLLSYGNTTLSDSTDPLPFQGLSGNIGADESQITPDTALGLKNWFGNIIHSMTLDYNGTTIIQQTPFSSMWNTFKLMTSLSWQDVHSMGATIGFYPDDPLAWIPTQSDVNNNPNKANGLGICNNVPIINARVASGNNTYNSQGGNAGFGKRLQYISYNPAKNPCLNGESILNNGGAYSALLSVQNTTRLWKSFVSNAVNATATKGGCVQISVMATIYLRHIHAFFNQAPLLKGAYMKMTLNLNNTTFSQVVATQTSSGATYQVSSSVSVSNAVGGVNPLMVSGTGDFLATTVAYTGTTSQPSGTYYGNVSVGATCLDSTIRNSIGVTTGVLANSIYLYVPSYTFNPVFEQAYLSNPVKQISYTDIYQYEVKGVTTGSTFNNLITNGIANMKSVLVMPFIATDSVLSAGVPAYQSPYDPAGCGATSPLAHFSNFNVVVSGQNMIYNTQRYAFEEFNNQFYGVNAVNGGLTDGLSSGLIDRLGWDMEQCFYYVDLSRMLPAEKSVPKSLQIVGENLCGQTLDLMVFVEYGLEIQIDSLTGVRM